jgi:hypothetical protein
MPPPAVLLDRFGARQTRSQGDEASDLGVHMLRCQACGIEPHLTETWERHLRARRRRLNESPHPLAPRPLRQSGRFRAALESVPMARQAPTPPAHSETTGSTCTRSAASRASSTASAASPAATGRRYASWNGSPTKPIAALRSRPVRPVVNDSMAAADLGAIQLERAMAARADTQMERTADRHHKGSLAARNRGRFLRRGTRRGQRGVGIPYRALALAGLAACDLRLGRPDDAARRLVEGLPLIPAGEMVGLATSLGHTRGPSDHSFAFESASRAVQSGAPRSMDRRCPHPDDGGWAAHRESVAVVQVRHRHRAP